MCVGVWQLGGEGSGGEEQDETARRRRKDGEEGKTYRLSVSADAGEERLATSSASPYPASRYNPAMA